MIVASIASLSSRAELLERTVESLYPQVDAFCIYLNGYTRVPDFLRRDKILHAILSCEAGWRGAEAKLWFWDNEEFSAAPMWRSDDVALICDDDLIYPADYARRMVGSLNAHPGSVSCVHGSIMMKPFERYSVSRMVARTTSSLEKTTQVHIPGTGTMAFRFGDVVLPLRGHQRSRFTWSHSVDPHAAVIFHEAGIPVYSVLRPPRWIVTQPLPSKGTAIFATRTGAGADANETKLLRDAGERLPWPDLPVPKDMTPRARELSQGAVAPAGPRGKAKASAPRENAHSMLPPEAIAMIGKKFGELADGGVVVELGSGFGTERLLDMLPQHLKLLSIEHDPAFVGLVERANYLYAPIHNGWYDTRTLKTGIPKDQVRLLIVDGPPGKIGRARLAKNLDLFPARVPMLIDDVHRTAERELARQIANLRGELLVEHKCDGRAFATIGW